MGVRHPHRYSLVKDPPCWRNGTNLLGADTCSNSHPGTPAKPGGASLVESSDIPNVEFKLDVTHCYKGWKISRPYACTFGFAHILNLAALDVGLLLYLSRRKGHECAPVEDADD